MPFASMHVANTILERAFAEGATVTPAKLQRILWFTAAEYRKATGEDLVSEAFEPWNRGPVIRSVHEKFRCFGAMPITGYAKDAAGNAHAVDVERDWPVAAALDSVWQRTAPYSERSLFEVATWPGSAWWDARQSGDDFIDREALGTDTSYRKMLGLGH